MNCGNSSGRAIVRYLTETNKCSERRACRLVRLPRATARYRAKGRAGEAVLVERLQKIGGKYPRFGYRRAHALLTRRDGQKINHIIDAAGVGSAFIVCGSEKACRCSGA